MQINGLSTTPAISLGTPSKAAPATTVDSDQAVLNVSPDSFSSFVQEAGQMPDVRSEMVDAFKSRIQSGEYPPQETVDGLVNVIGPAVLQQAKASS